MARDFLSYYEEALAKRGLSRSGKSPQPARSTGAPAFSIDPRQLTKTAPESTPLDALSTIVDLLSRGMYASTALASNVATDVATSQKFAPNNPLALAGAAMSGTARSFLPTEGSVWEGFFGNNPENKRTYSDVIEETTDKFGANDPNYVNRVDNVNPTLKGAAGLVGDIFLDPTTYIPGVVLGKALSLAARPVVKGVKALSYTPEGKVALKEAEAAKAAIQQGNPPPGAPPAGAAPGPTVPPTAPVAPQVVRASQMLTPGVPAALRTLPPPAKGAIPALTTPLPKVGAVGVAQRAVPVPTPAAPIVAATREVANLTATPATKVGNSVDTAIAAAEAKRAGVVAPKPSSAFEEMTQAEHAVRNVETTATEAARVSTAVEPLPEGAVKDLFAKLWDGKHARGGKPFTGVQANTLIHYAGSDADPKAVAAILSAQHMDEAIEAGDLSALSAPQRRVLESKARTAKMTVEEYAAGHHIPQVTPADKTFLTRLQDDAARGLHAAQEVERAEIAAKVANRKHDKLIEEAGAYTSVEDLYAIVSQAPYIARVKKFVAYLENLVGRTLGLRAPGAVLKEGKLTGTVRSIDEGTGLFDPKYAEVRQHAMYHWLRKGGTLDTEFKGEKFVLDLGNGVTKKVSVAQMRKVVDRLSKSENDELLMDAALGNSYRGPADLAEADGQIVQAIWKEFYDQIQQGSLAGDLAMRAIHFETGLEALQFAIKHDFKTVQRAVGDETADALLKTFGNNPARLNNHFTVLTQLGDPAFGPEQLAELIRKRAEFAIPGEPRSIVDTLFADMGARKELRSYRAHQELGTVENAVESAPSNVPAHPVSPEEVLATAKAIKGNATAGPAEMFKAGVVDILLKVFKRDVLEPQKLDLVTTTGVRVDSTLPDSKGWRTDLWNMPKQVEVYQSIYRYLNENSEAILKLDQSTYTRMKVDPKAPGYRKPDGSINWNQPGTMPLGERLKWEWQKILEIVDVVDTFLPSIGVRQVIGTSVDDAIPLSFGDVLKQIHVATEKGGVFGALGPEVRHLLFVGSQHQGAGKANPTNVLEAYRLMLTGAPKDEVVAQLLSDVLPGKRGALVGPTTEAQQKGGQFTLGQQPNNWNNPRYHDQVVVPSSFTKEETWKSVFPNASKQGNKVFIPGEDMAEAMYRLMDATSEEVGAIAIKNQRNAATAVKAESDLIIPEVSHEIMEVLAKDTTKVPELIQALSGIGKSADDIAEREGMYPASADVATERLEAEFGPDIVKQAKAQEQIAKSETRGAGPAQNEREHRAAVEETQRPIVADVQEGANQIADEDLAALLDNPEIRAGLEDLDSIPSPPAQGPPTGPPRGGKPPPPSGPPRGPAQPGKPPAPPTVINAARAVAETMDFSAAYHNGYLNAFGQLLFNVGKRFNASLGMKSLWPGLHSGGVLANSYLAKVSTELSDLSKTYSKDQITAAFKAIQSGTYNAKDPIVVALNNKLNLVWGSSSDSLLGNALLNGDPMLDHLNSMLRKYFPPDGSKNQMNPVPQFKMDEATAAMKADKNLTRGEALAMQWRNWDVRDGADFVLRLMSAAVNVAEHRAVVNLFDRNMVAWGGKSLEPQPGWVKPTASKDSAFIHFIDQNAYYPRELLSELHNADIFVSTSRQFSNEAGEWIRSTYVPWLNAWKRGMTINRPGHHIRTQIGDSILTFTGRGLSKSAQAGDDAFRIMTMAGKYEDVDFMRMLNALHEPGAVGMNTPHPVAEEVLFTGKVGGKDMPYTLGRAVNAIHTRGLKPTYHMGEGLYENTEMVNWFTKLAKFSSLEETGYGKFMGGLSQARDHWTRAQHFQQIMRQELTGRSGYRKKFKGQWKTIDELEDLAAKEVKKWHPDASMLTPFEAKGLRLVIPFYSWMSKIMPAFFESFLRHPGRVSIMPKASYELSVAMGVNPDSIYDPFPDSMFPSYLESKFFGPQFMDPSGGYFGINPGIPQADILNTFLGQENPVQAIAGMLTPAFRGPAELLSEASFGGVPIKDTSDYIDSQIPGGSYFAGITGISPTGALLGQGVEGLPWGEAGGEQRRMVREGKYEGLLNDQGAWSGDSITSLLNFVFGIGITGMSHPNQRNFAEIEARNAATGGG